MDFAEMKVMVESALAQSREEEGYSLGLQAFKYGYPVIEMYRSRWEWHYEESSPNYNGPINQFGHTRRATHEDTFVVTPINDAVYSRAFVDLSDEPYVIQAPRIDDRYWTIQHCDFYTNSFGYVGASKGDTEGGAFALVGPDWRGVLPAELTRVLVCPTPVACLLARVTVLNDDEAPAVALQKQFKLIPLSVWTGESSESEVTPAPKPYRDFKSGDPLDFFTLLNWCLTENPPPPHDAGIMGLFERIGVGPGMEFEPDKLHPAVVAGLQRAIKQGLTSMIAEMPFCVPNVNGWLIPNTSRSGNFGTDYYLRLETAEIGLLANDAREALYIGCFMDEHGEPLVGGRKYVMHFDKDQIPPVRQFWSLTMYTHPPGFLTESATNRYAIGSLTPGLKYNSDGSVDIYIQRDSPGADKESNWLPTTPPGELFRIIQRLYNPKGQILNGLWKPPAIRRVD
ncbi:MAG TPA: DUF1254 domain-containing protein [Anaerolineae bacterium]|nr:DUF1254 domain-containing protein [Anaerolineae bacterium]